MKYTVTVTDEDRTVVFIGESTDSIEDYLSISWVPGFPARLRCDIPEVISGA